jgi:hypothetical protein
MAKKPLRPWYETFPQNYWTQEDYAYARRDGWQGTEPRPIQPRLDQLPARIPETLVPTWSPFSAPVSPRTRAVDQILHDLGIR